MLSVFLWNNLVIGRLLVLFLRCGPVLVFIFRDGTSVLLFLRVGTVLSHKRFNGMFGLSVGSVVGVWIDRVREPVPSRLLP